jgi:hypothetical protein
MSRDSGNCPFCGLLVIKDDEAQAILHESPVCAKFSEMASKGNPDIETVPEQDVEKYFENTAEKVRKARS